MTVDGTGYHHTNNQVLIGASAVPVSTLTTAGDILAYQSGTGYGVGPRIYLNESNSLTGAASLHWYNDSDTLVLGTYHFSGSHAHLGMIRSGKTYLSGATGATSGSVTHEFSNYNGSSLEDLMIIRDDGTINMPSLPTSSAGLSSGDLWNDSGTLKIV